MAHSSAPLTLTEIARQAGDFEFGPYRNLKAWLRSAKLLLTEAAACEQDGNIERAYLYLMRHGELVLGKIPTLPDYKDPNLKAEVSEAQRAVKANFAKLEGWRPRIKADHERYLKAMERRNVERQRVQAERLLDERERWGGEEEEGPFEVEGRALDASQHRELAIDLAHREIRRRDASKQSTRQAGISPGTVAARRRGIVVDDEGLDGAQRRYDPDVGSGGDGVREAGRLLQQPGQRQQRREEPQRQSRTTSSFQYPSVPTKENEMDWRMQPLQPRPLFDPPRVPAKESFSQHRYPNNLPAPPLPPKSQDLQPPSDTPPPSSTYTFAPSATTESGVPLRPLFLPPTLRTTFLNLAHPNTLQNLETCGILCGTLISSALFITHLIVPDQNSTSDTCDTTEAGDNALFDYCDSQSLLVCGWIHTHPTQTCFLSSRDLHTSSGYQVMLPEAIAIVCAPRHNPDWGVFRLTDPPGLKHVLKCERKGLFHPHEERDLYTDAGKPGHVVEGPGLEFQVVDLRR